MKFARTIFILFKKSSDGRVGNPKKRAMPYPTTCLAYFHLFFKKKNKPVAFSRLVLAPKS